MEEGTSCFGAILFNAESFSDLLDRLADVDAVMDYDNQVMEELTAARQELGRSGGAGDARAEEQAAREQQEAKRAEQQAKVAQAQKLLEPDQRRCGGGQPAVGRRERGVGRHEEDIARKRKELRRQRKQNDVQLRLPATAGCGPCPRPI